MPLRPTFVARDIAFYETVSHHVGSCITLAHRMPLPSTSLALWFTSTTREGLALLLPFVLALSADPRNFLSLCGFATRVRLPFRLPFTVTRSTEPCNLRRLHCRCLAFGRHLYPENPPHTTKSVLSSVYAQSILMPDFSVRVGGCAWCRFGTSTHSSARSTLHPGNRARSASITSSSVIDSPP